jgi:hypothetical protein
MHPRGSPLSVVVVCRAPRVTLHVRDFSVTTGGGNRLPSILGFDACGADEGVATIPVPSHALREAYKPSAATLSRWRDSAASAVADDDIAGALALVSASQLSRTVRVF